MDRPWPALIVVAAAAAVVWAAVRPRFVFVVAVRGGRAAAERGVVTAGFVAEVGEAFARHGVRDGWVGAVRRGRRLALAFPRGVPPGCRQQLRNVWALDGWSA